MKELIVAAVLFTSALCGCSDGESSSTTLSTPGTTSVLPNTTPTTVASSTVTTSTVKVDPYKITLYTWEVSDMADEWWTFTYKVVIQNNTGRSLSLNLMVQYLDSDNQEMAVEVLMDMNVPPEGKTVTGTTKIDAKVAWDMIGISVGFF